MQNEESRRFVNTNVPLPMSVRQSLHNLQRCGAFIAAFPEKNERRQSKKVYSAIVLVRCKTKGVVEAVCALLRNWQLGA
jgi:hypothetical protein